MKNKFIILTKYLKKAVSNHVLLYSTPVNLSYVWIVGLSLGFYFATQIAIVILFAVPFVSDATLGFEFPILKLASIPGVWTTWKTKKFLNKKFETSEDIAIFYAIGNWDNGTNRVIYDRFMANPHKYATPKCWGIELKRGFETEFLVYNGENGFHVSKNIFRKEENNLKNKIARLWANKKLRLYILVFFLLLFLAFSLAKDPIFQFIHIVQY